jgi:hypothetical protein
MLHDQKEAIDIAIERADHIHARVGFTEGPQYLIQELKNGRRY